MTSVEFENARVGIPSQNELVLYRLDQVENSIKEIKHGVDKLGEKLSKKIELFTEIQRESFAKFILTERRVTEMEAGFSEGKTETREINRRIDEVDKRAGGLVGRLLDCSGERLESMPQFNCCIMSVSFRSLLCLGQ